jgi:hypothetical protein
VCHLLLLGFSVVPHESVHRVTTHLAWFGITGVCVWWFGYALVIVMNQMMLKTSKQLLFDKVLGFDELLLLYFYGNRSGMLLSWIGCIPDSISWINWLWIWSNSCSCCSSPPWVERAPPGSCYVATIIFLVLVWFWWWATTTLICSQIDL